jgi:hypothetical protein
VSTITSQSGAGIASRPGAGPSFEPPAPPRGLLITADAALTRGFLRDLRSSDSAVAFDVRASLADARGVAGGRHRWVAVDLDGAVPPDAAVHLARRLWPAARIGVLSCWWSEQDVAARTLADVVIHKPLRAAEIRAFLQADAATALSSALRTA